jgi:hypothetical protein
MQRQHAGRAQHHVVTAQGRFHQRHARAFTLRDELAVLVDHHPLTVPFEAGFDRRCAVDRHARARLHRMQEQTCDRDVVITHQGSDCAANRGATYNVATARAAAP